MKTIETDRKLWYNNVRAVPVENIMERLQGVTLAVTLNNVSSTNYKFMATPHKVKNPKSDDVNTLISSLVFCKI